MLLFLGSLCNGVLEALANVERAVLAALATPTPRRASRQPYNSPLLSSTCSALHACCFQQLSSEEQAHRGHIS